MRVSIRHRLQGEEGFTMAMVMVALLVVTGVATVALAASTRDLNLTRNDLDQKEAYAAAQAGINDYAFQLNKDTSYWTKCAGVPSPTAVNLADGSTDRRRYVPGSTTAQYKIELLPRSDYAGQCSVSDPVGSMIESGGSFRIRSTGYAGDSERSIVATFKPGSFLDYVYFTQYETSDPVTYDESQIDEATAECETYVRDGRPVSSGGNTPCVPIQFAPSDEVNGPLHTNDQLLTCGSPTFGRTASDVIEVSWSGTGNPPVGYTRASGCSGSPNFLGTPIVGASTITPPANNSELKNDVQSTFKYSQQVRICLAGTTMTVGTGSSCTGKYSGPIPSNGLIYVANNTSNACPPAANGSSYDPFRATYPSTSWCGNAYVSGYYTVPLTIAAENDIIISGNLCRGSCSSEPSGSGILGLIANNFVRIYHPFCPQASGTPTCTTTTAQEGAGDCTPSGSSTTGENGAGTLYDPRIDAAILAINHSFIVDHYDCGASLGTLEINGAISQKFRGAVGVSSGAGYVKDYWYDDRFLSISPPYYLEPQSYSWHVQRETLDFP